MSKSDILRLKKWFLYNARDLPWRGNPTPYEVWVSEVMLQQTQVSVVIPYFLTWMERFPTITALANASEEAVIKVWEGLGYYSRARNLHQGAKYVLEKFDGALPNNSEALRSIKGLGPYTVGAILSFAFHQKAAAVDGNVQRVLARYYLIQEEISKTTVQKQLQQLAEGMLPEEEPWIISEALIELGAKVCSRQPNCPQCPLKKGCLAYAKGVVLELPKRKERVATTLLHRLTGLIHSGGAVLLRQVKKGALMGGLYEFPYIEVSSPPEAADPLIEWLASHFIVAEEVGQLPMQKHGFTKYQAYLYPYRLEASERKDLDGYTWVEMAELHQLPFPSGHRDLKNYF